MRQSISRSNRSPGGELPPFALDELRQTLQVIWEGRELLSTQRQLGAEELQIAIRGADVGAGRAPLGLVLDKVIGVRSLLYRINGATGGSPSPNTRSSGRTDQADLLTLGQRASGRQLSLRHQDGGTLAA